MQASADVPYAVLSAKPQLRECFVTCPLPGPGQAVGEVALRTREGATLAVHTVEVRGPLRRRTRHGRRGMHACGAGAQEGAAGA